MWKRNLEKPVIFIVGPTASGKTTLSIQLATILNTEVISADSRYFYRMMDIGTAKPDENEMGNIKHHMINIADPDETISVAVFKEQVTEIIAKMHQESKIPIVVGGTGQYIHAILHNWEMPELESDHELRELLENYAERFGKLKLYEFLQKVDPEAAKIIDFRNLRRTVRAIEVMLKTGYRFSEQRKQQASCYSQKIIGIRWDRSVLYQRIDGRIEKMIENGFIEEVRRLIDLGYSSKLPSMSAIGYRELAGYIQGENSLEEAIILMKRNSRTYVRRQSNWFKDNDPNIKWFESDGLDYRIVVDYIKSEGGWIKPE
ncbi:MAG: tRNA (adenosine(37)-N6)-dimethylallyltransferase MiaA [Chloroflexi bacterium HGW-Chloroflexi-2]|jgi:tRNA dimethylallyltransferase|nr:MAG: tRNA (adenosine(37)-N6)-dimethylallyltransferase MiaA [Chloroflexi bacterium HGW-Chloroflexi-2]